MDKHVHMNETALQMARARLDILSEELSRSHADREDLSKKIDDLDIRVHQICGAIYELQQLIAALSDLSD